MCSKYDQSVGALGFRTRRRFSSLPREEDIERKLDKTPVQQLANKIIAGLLVDKKKAKRSFQAWLTIEQDRQAKSRAKLAAKREKKKQEEEAALEDSLKQPRPKSRKSLQVRKREKREFHERQERLLAHLKELRDVREQEVVEEELNGCTFQPAICSTDAKSRYKAGIITNPVLNSDREPDRSRLNKNLRSGRRSSHKHQASRGPQQPRGQTTHTRRKTQPNPGQRKDSRLTREPRASEVRTNAKHKSERSSNRSIARGCTKPSHSKAQRRPSAMSRTQSIDSDLHSPQARETSRPVARNRPVEEAEAYIFPRSQSRDSDLLTPRGTDNHMEYLFPRSLSRDSDLRTPRPLNWQQRRKFFPKRTELPRSPSEDDSDLNLSRELIRSYSMDSDLQTPKSNVVGRRDRSVDVDANLLLDVSEFEQMELQEPPSPYLPVDELT